MDRKFDGLARIAGSAGLAGLVRLFGVNGRFFEDDLAEVPHENRVSVQGVHEGSDLAHWIAARGGQPCGDR